MVDKQYTGKYQKLSKVEREKTKDKRLTLNIYPNLNMQPKQERGQFKLGHDAL